MCANRGAREIIVEVLAVMVDLEGINGNIKVKDGAVEATVQTSGARVILPKWEMLVHSGLPIMPSIMAKQIQLLNRLPVSPYL